MMPACPSIQPQRGIVVFTLLVFMMMVSLLVLWTFRGAWLNEALAGNGTDYQRTFEAAQALMLDAETDIRQINAIGEPCHPQKDNESICRHGATAPFPLDAKNWHRHIEYLKQFPHGCSQGICRQLDDPHDFWTNPAVLLKMTEEGVGARYGQFTGAPLSSGIHPLLAKRGRSTRMKDIQGAWYWVELIPHASANRVLLAEHAAPMSRHSLSPHRTSPWIYRITVYARGHKSGTEVVLQTVMTLQPPH